LIFAVILLLGSFAWSVWRDRMLCPVCEHAMTDHEREMRQNGSPGSCHCKVCDRDCC
jgi:hypothetical protein